LDIDKSPYYLVTYDMILLSHRCASLTEDADLRGDTI